MANNGYTLRKRGGAWQVDIGRKETGGKRLQKSFRTKAKATAWATRKLQELTIIGSDAVDLSGEELKAANKALGILKERGFPRDALVEAAEFYAHHHDPTRTHRTVEAAFAEQVESREKANRRPITIHDLHQRVGRFAQDFGKRHVHEITVGEMEEWLDSKGYYNPITRDNYIRHLITFYKFCIKRGYAQANPALGLDRPSKEEVIPRILTVKEVRAFLEAAQKKNAELIPFLAVSIFAGLRREEAIQLDWSQIDLDRRTVTVTPQTAKKRRTRYVEMSDNLVDWLLPHLRESGQLYYSRNYLEKARDEAGIAWSLDIMRHTFGSYHVAMHNNAALTALQMGHTRTSTLFEHYRQAVRAEDAEAFWNIRPDDTQADSDQEQGRASDGCPL